MVAIIPIIAFLKIVHVVLFVLDQYIVNLLNCKFFSPLKLITKRKKETFMNINLRFIFLLLRYF